MGTSRASSGDQIELGDVPAERASVSDELGQEFVQAALEDRLDAAEPEPGVELAGKAVALAAFAAVAFRNEVEIARDLRVARAQRARHLGPQDQQLGDLPRMQP